MTDAVKNVAILGSTGSIGRNALEVIAAASGKYRVLALSAHRNTTLAIEQACRFRPRWLVATDSEAVASTDWSQLPPETQLLSDADSAAQVAAHADVDVVVAAIVGSAGLRSTWAAVAAGKTVALANKETLVVAGPLVMELARTSGATILPVDSEHSAVLQVLQAGRRDEVRRIVLTASGGPFRDHPPEALADVTVEEALAHPTWQMGAKITIDSATMMNKALEIVEARWLFDLTADQIDVVVHPQSIVHSMVEFVDGSVVAQLGSPDMRLPIQYALSYPRRSAGVADRVDWRRRMSLEFAPPDLKRFPALDLGWEVARTGGTTGAVLSAANEAAVAAFLDRNIGFCDIVPLVRQALDRHDFDPHPELEQLVELDRWARLEVSRCTAC
ncbi:MAG: 1-deoxy-D-xylulose-5-phosphate reductoisomerase [Pirellulales bacterium]|nr:1-deoxy-D-xylulose-5-phosphate reductoisomerase [Planctomycetales bacterium]